MVNVLQGQVKITAQDGYVAVWHGRSAEDLKELDVILRAIDTSLRRARVNRLLFDSRDSDYTAPEVGERLWQWLEERELEKVATLVHSRNLAVSVRMTGLAKKVQIRAFDHDIEAERWLKA